MVDLVREKEVESGEGGGSETYINLLKGKGCKPSHPFQLERITHISSMVCSSTCFSDLTFVRSTEI